MGTDERMGTITATAMPDATLTLMQWLSPAFPVGAFAYSHGLEEAIVTDRIQTSESLFEWLEDICEFGAGHSDLVLLSAAYHGRVKDADAMAEATSPSMERLQETRQQGSAFCDAVNAVWGLNLDPLAYPVAVGAAAGSLSLPLELTAQMYLHAFLANLASAAVRLVPLGQTEGQAVLVRLKPLIEQTSQSAVRTPLDDIQSACFAADIASMRHETLETRIFRT